MHDLVVAPLTIVVGLVLLRLAPRAWRGSVVAATLVVATVTVAAVPVLGRFGARPDNPTLLDRDYRTGWLVVRLRGGRGDPARWSLACSWDQCGRTAARWRGSSSLTTI